MVDVMGFDCLNQDHRYWMAYSTCQVGSFRTTDFQADKPQPALNRTAELLAQQLPSISCLIFPNIDHQSEVCMDPEDHATRSLIQIEHLQVKKAIQTCDALITTDRRVCLAMPAADCPPISVAGMINSQPAIGLAHGSWKAIAKGVIQKFIARFDHSQDNSLWVRIGPGIGPCCFEVDLDVVDVFNELLPRPKDVILPPAPPQRTKYHIDLNVALLQLLMSAGLNRQRITLSLECTRCDNRYFSRRGGDDQQFVALLALRP